MYTHTLTWKCPFAPLAVATAMAMRRGETGSLLLLP